MSGETHSIYSQNEETHPDDSFLRGTSVVLAVSSKDIKISDTSTTVNSSNLSGANSNSQLSSLLENQSPSDIHFPVTAWPMFLEKYLQQAREISKVFQYQSISSVESSFKKSTKVAAGTMITSSSSKKITSSETKRISQHQFMIQKIKQKRDTMKDRRLSSPDISKLSSRKVDKQESSIEERSQISTRRPKRSCTIAAPSQKKLVLAEDVKLSLSDKSNSELSLNSLNFLPEKRPYPSIKEVSTKNGK
ncbi:hypothetical protein V9T40_008787 [Parthenolecanium corni]|uniref:Uncharacterized protein n=1 Tax=Parthenolecanium corni TaxID=536013 RepID=A0AAN9TNR6_9HEMI